MVSESRDDRPLPPVPFTGSRTGHTMMQPARQMMDSTRRKRRKKKPSSEQLLRM
jgi:hypothetical protein